MQQTTLQQRINERAEKKLLQDLRDATNKEQEVARLVNRGKQIGEELLYTPRLEVKDHYGYSNHTEIRMYNDYSQKVFDLLLPFYIKDVTDEILRKIDEIDFLVFEKNLQEQEY